MPAGWALVPRCTWPLCWSTWQLRSWSWQATQPATTRRPASSPATCHAQHPLCVAAQEDRQEGVDRNTCCRPRVPFPHINWCYFNTTITWNDKTHMHVIQDNVNLERGVGRAQSSLHGIIQTYVWTHICMIPCIPCRWTFNKIWLHGSDVQAVSQPSLLTQRG
jgi:hypothetical protein